MHEVDRAASRATAMGTKAGRGTRPLRNWIIAPGLEGIAADDAFHGEPPAFGDPITAYGLVSVLRAARHVTAGRGGYLR
jgi:hypothetical protein